MKMYEKTRPSTLDGTQWGNYTPATPYTYGVSTWLAIDALPHSAVSDSLNDIVGFHTNKCLEAGFGYYEPITTAEDYLLTTRGLKDDFNPVLHKQSGPVLHDYGYAHRIVVNRFSGGLYNQIHDVQVAHCDQQPYGLSCSVPDLILAEGEELRNLRARGYYSMYPRFQGDLDLLLFLAELKDVQDIFRHIKRFSLKSVKRLIHDLLGGKKKIKDLDPTRPAAESHLLYNFGIKPLLDEIGVLMEQMYHIVGELQDQFQADGELWQTSHYTEVIDGKVPTVTLGYTTSFKSVWSPVTWATYTATMGYKYDYSIRSKLDAIIKYHGLDLSFSTLYNYCPFSFLLDYVIDLGKVIGFMELDPNVTLTECKFGESFKTTSESGRYIRPGSGEYYKWLVFQQQCCVGTEVLTSEDTRLVSGYRASSYQRKPVSIPRGGFGTALPKLTSGFTTGQQLNVAALGRVFM